MDIEIRLIEDGKRELIGRWHVPDEARARELAKVASNYIGGLMRSPWPLPWSKSARGDKRAGSSADA